jgi:hypothetical protein
MANSKRKPTVPSGGLAVQLLRLMSIRAANDYVERFHVFAKTCSSGAELADVFTRTHERILCALRIRVEKSEQELEVDTLEIDDHGQIRLRCGTKLSHKHSLPTMALRFEANGDYMRPGSGDGVAAYCIWANTTGRRPGVAVVHDVQKSADIEFFAQTTDAGGEGIGWYKPETIRDMYKQPPKGKAPYRSLLTAQIVQVCSASGDLDETPEAKCLGVLNVTSTVPAAFGVEDCAWIQTGASLLGSLYESFSARQLELTGRASLPAPESRHELPDVVEDGRASSPHLASESSLVPSSRASTEVEQRLLSGGIRLWKPAPHKDDFLFPLKVAGGGEQDRILERLERDGFVLIRWEGVGPAPDRLETFEQWLGTIRTRQNDHIGPVKIISPKAGVAANTGDSADEIDPHVDGTQDDVTPALLAFEYLTTASYGGISSFIDMASVLLSLGDEAETVLTALAQPDVAVMEKKGLRYAGPLITTVRGDAVAVRLRYDDRLEAKDKVLSLKPQYEPAFNRLKKAVFDAGRLEFTHNEGDIALFDNWRVLHARRALGKQAHHPRHHRRMWIHDLLPREQNRRLGVRGLAPAVVSAIQAANKNSSRSEVQR